MLNDTYAYFYSTRLPPPLILGNQVRKLTSSSYIKVDIDPSYSINFVDKIAIQDIRLNHSTKLDRFAFE